MFTPIAISAGWCISIFVPLRARWRAGAAKNQPLAVGVHRLQIKLSGPQAARNHHCNTPDVRQTLRTDPNQALLRTVIAT